ncbi:CpsD/CapB family tyrosine-protein kinase [Cohnella sp.]|uniref:CpsD/CapB family tyrosine-protein kinase n=1 Tax=Cohnella sp. TaxID=1883426 RepID=UPI003563D144
MDHPIQLLTGKSKSKKASKLNSIATDSYRALKINIEFKAIGKDIKTLVITSSMRGEGKTITSLNLAIAYAQSGKKVLLIDADLRKPGVHLLFEGDYGRGLTHFLINESTLSETIQKTNIPDLSVITSGSTPSNPSELLTSPQMDILINEVKQNYDIILIDTPPILGFIETKMLAAKCCGVVFVVEHGIVKKSVASKAKDEILSVKANLLGVVMNKMKKKEASI